MTKNRIKYIIFTLIIGIFSLFFYNMIFLILFIVDLALPPLSILAAKYTASRVEVGISFDKKIIAKNKEASVVLKAINRSFFPIVNLNIGVRIANNFFKEPEEFYVNAAVGVNSERKLELKTSSIFCGNISAIITDVYMFDILGLKIFEIEYKDDRSENLMVLPEIVDVKIDYDEFTLGDGDENNKQVIGEDTSEISNIRNYIAGDRLQRIHWKLSVKQNDLMVKEYSDVYDDEICVLVELEEDNISLIIDIAFTVAYSLLEEQQRFSLIWYNNGSEELEKCEIIVEEDILEAMRQIYFSNVYNKKYGYIKFCDEYVNEKSNLIYVSGKSEFDNVRILCEIKDKVVISCLV